MEKSLQKFLLHLRQDVEIAIGTETATREGAILPVLRRLGWDTENKRELRQNSKLAVTVSIIASETDRNRWGSSKSRIGR